MSDSNLSGMTPPPVPPLKHSDMDGSEVVRPYVDPEVLAEDARAAERRKHRRRMSRDHIRRVKRRKRIRAALLAFGVLLAVVAALTVWFGCSAVQAKREAEAAVRAAASAQAHIEAGDTGKARASIEDCSRRIDAAYAQTRQPVWWLATFVPYYGSDVKAVRDMVHILEDVSNNALPKLDKSVQALSLNGIGIKDGVIHLGDMAGASSDLAAANEVVADASVNMNKIGGTHIPQITEAVRQGRDKFGELAKVTDAASRLADVLPGMLDVQGGANGRNGPRTYLVLAQNNAELRATGGIPTAWSTLTVEDGTISMGTFADPPRDGMFSQDEAMNVLTADERTLFSTKMATDAPDINFTPDFPRVADIARRIWQRSGHGDVDGVISVDPVFLQRLLKIAGPVTLSDGTVMNGENAEQRILNQIYIDTDTQAAQTDFFTMVAGEIFAHVLNGMDGKTQQLMRTFQKSASDGHLYVWSAHEREQKRISGTPIAGELRSGPSHPVTGVYFNDATMGKMDWYLKREVTSTYDKTYPNGAKQYTIHISLANTADAASVNAAPDLLRGYDHSGKPRTGEIETVLYVYAPDGGRIVDWTRDFDQLAMHGNLTVGMKTVTLRPGERFETTVHVLASPAAGDNAMVLRQTPVVD